MNVRKGTGGFLAVVLPITSQSIKMKLKIQSSQLVLMLVCVVLLVTNVFLISRNFRLSAMVEKSKQFILDEGYTFDSLHLKGLNGGEETFGFSGQARKSMLLVFNTACEYCVQQYPYWNEVASKLDHSKWRFLAITRERDSEKVKAHLREYKFDSIQTGLVSPQEMDKSRMVFTPMTVIIDESGKVTKVLPGIWDGDLTSIEPQKD